MQLQNNSAASARGLGLDCIDVLRLLGLTRKFAGIAGQQTIR